MCTVKFYSIISLNKSSGFGLADKGICAHPLESNCEQLNVHNDTLMGLRIPLLSWNENGYDTEGDHLQ